MTTRESNRVRAKLMVPFDRAEDFTKGNVKKSICEILTLTTELYSACEYSYLKKAYLCVCAKIQSKGGHI